MPPLPAPPLLTTYPRKPTWVNRAGRIDRSALIEIRASDIWRRATFHPAPIRRDPAAPTAFAEYKLTAPLVNELHAKRLPFALDGDYRTQKSNAMKCPRYAAAPGSLRNPNRGAARTKMLALNAEGNLHGMWQFTVRIERRERITREPLQSRESSEPPRPRSGARKNRAQHRDEDVAAHNAPPSHQHMLICPQCERAVLKLFLVLCSRAEGRDAELAEGWIKLLEHRAAAARQTIPATLMQRRAKFIERYGLLFHKRRPLCRLCLGVRYGEAKTRKGKRVPFPKLHSGRTYDSNRPW